MTLVCGNPMVAVCHQSSQKQPTGASIKPCISNNIMGQQHASIWQQGWSTWPSDVCASQVHYNYNQAVSCWSNIYSLIGQRYCCFIVRSETLVVIITLDHHFAYQLYGGTTAFGYEHHSYLLWGTMQTQLWRYLQISKQLPHMGKIPAVIWPGIYVAMYTYI